MLSRHSLRKYKKGDKITAADKNFMLQEARTILVGGRGIDVTNVGGKVHIGLTPSQIIQKAQSGFGSILRLTKGLKFRWGTTPTTFFDIGTCVDLAITDSYVYGMGNASGGNPYQCVALAQLNLSGEELWNIRCTSINEYAWQIAANDEHDVAVSQNGPATDETKQFSVVDGAEEWGENITGAAGSTHGANGYFWDGTYYWTITQDSTGASMVNKLYFQDKTGFIGSPVTLSGGPWRTERIFKRGTDIYFCGAKGSGSSYTHFVKLNTSGTVSWGFDAGGAPGGSLGNSRWGFSSGAMGCDICADVDDNVYGVGFRSNSWTGASGTYASLWKFNSSGTVQWTWDSGGNLYSCCIDSDSGHLYVCGARSNSWDTGVDYKTVWKINPDDGVVIASYDSGKGTIGSEAGNAWAIRQHGSFVYVGCLEGVA